MPVMLGVLGGAFAGSKLLSHVNVPTLRKVFAVVIAILALEMLYSGLTGKL